MSGRVDTELVISITRKIIEQTKRDELPLFPTISAVYTANPRRLRKQQVAHDRSLGFSPSPGDLVAVWTPAILFIVQQALIQASSDATKPGVKALVRSIEKRLFKRSRKRFAHPPGMRFSPDALLLIKDAVYEAACGHEAVHGRRFSETQARDFADLVIEQLAPQKSATEE